MSTLAYHIEQRPRTALVGAFAAWKLILAIIVLLSPGPGYDTSTQLLFHAHEAPLAGPAHFFSLAAARLTRWDAFYYVAIAHRDYAFEQEWAFSWGFTRIVRLVAQLCTRDDAPSLLANALSGIVVANVSHLLAVLVLYQLVAALTDGRSKSAELAFIAAALHIISPAGVFLSAPYGESTFALLNFAGCLIYVYTTQTKSPGIVLGGYLLVGLCFGTATTVRGNGLLGGLVLLTDFAWTLWNFSIDPRAFRSDSTRLLFLGAAGLFVAYGFAIPQIVAYRQLCQSPRNASVPSIAPDEREWCQWTLPSVHSWVQSRYWDNGFLRYWTIPNIPLFLMAGPMLVVLFYTAFTTLVEPYTETSSPPGKPSNPVQIDQKQEVSVAQASIPMLSRANPFARSSLYPYRLSYRNFKTTGASHCLRQVAVVQGVLALLALTNLHVQIISRISSGYPLWYFVLANWIVDGSESHKKWARWAVRWMVGYAVVQGGLFACFLPPA